MSILGDLVVRITGDTSGLERAVNAGSKAVTSFSVSIQRRAIPALTGLATKAVAAGGALLGITSVAGFAAWGVKLAAEAETAEVAFGTLLGSAESARKLMGELKDFAATTPLSMGEVRDATRMLLAFGTAQDEVLPTLRRIGDVASLTGNAIGEVAEIYGKARVQGRLFAEDINQLQGRGIPVAEQFAKQLGVTTEQLRKMVEQGKVSFSNLEQAFIDMTSASGMFADGMVAQSETLAGRWSTLQDTIAGLARTLGEAFVGPLTEIVELTTQWLDGTMSIGEGMDDAATSTDGLTDSVATLADMFASVSDTSASLLDRWNAGVSRIGLLAASAAKSVFIGLPKEFEETLQQIENQRAAAVRNRASGKSFTEQLAANRKARQEAKEERERIKRFNEAKQFNINRRREAGALMDLSFMGQSTQDLMNQAAALVAKQQPFEDAIAKARETKPVRLQANEAALFGTMEAQRIINAQMVGGGMEDIARKQLKTLEDIADNTKAAKPAVGPQLAVVPAL